MNSGINAINDEVQRASAFVRPLLNEMSQVVVGQNYLVERLVIGLLANGHVLLEGVPGLAKTLAVKSLAQCLSVKFSRLQFTPDLLPADLIGTQIYNPQSGGFTTRRGPVFANIVLATQNPTEQEGTYNLPEAQVDRFMLKLKVTYPSRAEERQILDLMAKTGPAPQVKAVVTPAEIFDARRVLNEIYIDDKVKDYIVDVVCCTRDPKDYKIQLDGLIQMGASPRATIALTLAAKAHAFLKGRGYVTPQDVKSVGMDVLRHRVTVTYEAEAEDKTSETIINKIFSELPVP